MDTMKLTYTPPEGWNEACSRSHNRYLNDTALSIDIKEKCSEPDGNPCRFLRAIGQYGQIVGYVCLFSKCIKRYPTEEDLMEIEK